MDLNGVTWWGSANAHVPYLFIGGKTKSNALIQSSVKMTNCLDTPVPFMFRAKWNMYSSAVYPAGGPSNWDSKYKFFTEMVYVAAGHGENNHTPGLKRFGEIFFIKTGDNAKGWKASIVNPSNSEYVNN